MNLLLILIALMFVAPLFADRTPAPKPAPKAAPARPKEPTPEQKAQKELLDRLGYEPGPYTVRDFLRRVARDPDSVEVRHCGSALAEQERWVITCDWTAKNGFGGTVRSVNRFYAKGGGVYAYDG